MPNVGFEPGTEDSYEISCGGDVFKQTVPDTSSGDRKSLVADGRQSGAADEEKMKTASR